MSQTCDPVLVIAEAGVNHNGSVQIAHEMIEAARCAGADVIKFQLFDTDKLVTAEARQADYQVQNTGFEEGQHSMLRRLELGREAHVELAEHAAKAGLEFLSTPFDPESLDFLINDVGVRRIKLSSADLTDVLMVSRAALSELPLILSTGMASLAEVSDAVDLFAFVATVGGLPTCYADYEGFASGPSRNASWRDRLTLLQCTSEYPTPEGHENVMAMVTLRRRWQLPVGYSDHTLGSTAAICAVALGASVVEKHFTLDRAMSGPDHAASLAPDDFANYVRKVRHAQVALGSGVKAPTPVEQETAAYVRKVIVAARRIERGESLSLDNLTTKRAGKGMSSRSLWELLGRPAGKSYAADEIVVEGIDEV